MAAIAKAAVFLLTFSTPSLIHGATVDIDTSDALVVGTHRVSAYRVDKNYQRFIGSQNAPPPGDLEADVTSAWFARFLAEQVLTAQALKEGYGERPEVTREVFRMERHMLTQFNGPFYQHLLSTTSRSAPAADLVLAGRQPSFDVEILRAPADAPVVRLMSDSLNPNASTNQEPDLRAMDAFGQSEYFSGWIAWPFEPFNEIAGVIPSAPVGSWQKFDSSDSLLVFRVRAVRPIATSAAGQGGPPVELVQILDQQRVQRERQRRIIREAGLTFNWAAAQRWVDRIVSAHPDPLQPLDQTLAAEMLTTQLASFQHRNTRETVTVAEYIDYYNDLYVRNIPRKALDVFNAIRAIVAARRDDDEARELGIDREPKFVEDRRNYRDLLALDLYVKERVRPALGVSDDDVARYYDAHVSAFTQPARVAGTLFVFSEFGDAESFAQAQDPARTKALFNRAQERKTLVLTRTTELPEMSFLPGLVFSGQAIRTLGPFPTADAFAVWVGERVVDSETLPLAAASQEIRTKLEESRLDRYKAELARKLSPDFSIEDKIAYKKYGIDDIVIKPWSS